MQPSSVGVPTEPSAISYFFDHETDSLSLQIGNMADFRAVEDVAPGVIVYVGRARRPLAVEIRGASKIVATSGLSMMHEVPITAAELSKRLSVSPAGRTLLMLLVPR